LSGFNENLFFLTDFRKMLQYQISLKTVQWEPSCSMRMDRQKKKDGRTDGHDKASNRFRNFATAPKKKKTQCAQSADFCSVVPGSM
jgi:hypothetical protein